MSLQPYEAAAVAAGQVLHQASAEYRQAQSRARWTAIIVGIVVVALALPLFKGSKR